jgi:ADP-ribosylglycohydrolase
MAKIKAMRVDADRFAGCLIGQCLGDALGFIVEGQSPAVCQRYVNEFVRTGNAREQRRGRYRFGQYSDDSQLAREMILSFIECRTFDPADYASRVASLFAEGRVVGRGVASAAAATRLIRGTAWNEAGEEPPSAGNGSAMRAGPVGLLFFGRPDDLVQVAHDQGRITHRDRRCSAGAIAIAGAVALNLQNPTSAVAEIIPRLCSMVESFDPVLAASLERMPRWLCQSPATAAIDIARVGFAPGSDSEWEGISPFVTPSVLWSLYSFFRSPDDYMESICTAIAVGGDVDTTAAMTGAISGARVGISRLPQALTQLLNDNGTWGYDALVGLANQCYSLATEPSS